MAYLDLHLEDRERPATTQTSARPTHPALTLVEERAEYWLLQDLQRRWPRVVRDVQDLVAAWPEADRYAARDATIGDVLVDSRMLGAAVRHRFASAPRWALLAACDQIAVETTAGFEAIQDAVRAAGVALRPGAGVAATAEACEHLGLLRGYLREHLARLAAETPLVEC